MAEKYFDQLEIGGEVYKVRDAALSEDMASHRKALGYQVVEGPNKWNPDEDTLNASINRATSNYGEVYVLEGYTTSGFIAAIQGDIIRWDYRNALISAGELLNKGTSLFRIAEYDADKKAVYVSADWAALPYTVQNASTKFVRLVVPTNITNSVTFGDSTTGQITYIPYEKTTEFMRIVEVEKNIANTVNPAEVILPSAIYGVAGQQINIYKENLMLNNRLKSLAYIHTRMGDNAVQDDMRTIWNPSATALKETVRTWEIMRNGLTKAETKTIKTCAVPKDTGAATIKVLVIGDSKVEGGFVSHHFLHNFDDDNMSATMLGSKYTWSEQNRHEGWSGKTAEWFCTNANSPMSNGGACDFAGYLSTHNIDTPDFVFINLGTNDCASASGGDTSYLTKFVNYISQMIESIHSVSSNIKVIVGLCEGVATVQDTNNAEFVNWDINQKISNLHKATIAAFDNRQDENIYVCPMYMGMDLTQDYAMTEAPLSARDGDVNNGSGNGKTRKVITDPVHQSEVGYWKNADYMYAIVKYIVAK